MAAPYVGFGICVLIVMARDLNLLCLGDDEARNLGVDPTGKAYYCIRFVFGDCSLGFGRWDIGFVGLVALYVMRMVVGPDHRLLLPSSIIAGGIFLVLADTIAHA